MTHARNADQMHVLTVFIAMVVGMVIFAFVYAWTTVTLLMARMEQGFSTQRAAREMQRKQDRMKQDSILIELRSWRERQ